MAEKKIDSEVEEVKTEEKEETSNEETKEQFEVNENATEEVTTQNEPSTEENENKEPIKLEADHDYEEGPLQEIENFRLEFLKKYKLHNGLKILVGGIGMALIVVAFLVIPGIAALSEGARLALMIILGVLSIAGMFTYNLVVKKLMNKKMQKYFDVYYECTTKFAFANQEFVDVSCNAKDKITDEEFKNNNLWLDIVQVGSRAKTTFKFHDIEMFICDAAGQIRNNKVLSPVFVGKYIVAPTSYKDSNPIVIYLKGDKRAIPPTNVSDLKNVYDDKKMAIYSNNSQWSKVVTKKVKDSVLKLETGKDLIDVSISIQDGIMYVCLGYDDSLMVLPLEKPLDARPVKEYRKNLLEACEFIETLNNK